MQHPTLTLKKGKSSSVERFHPWVFSGAIHQKSQDLEKGQVVDSLDSSAKAMELTEINLALNPEDSLPRRSLTEDAFEFLKDINQRYDLIVLDPPAFAKHQKVLDRALKGYRKINKLAFEQIQSGGLLFPVRKW